MAERFTFAGPTPSNNIAVWTDFAPVSGVSVERGELPATSRLHQNYPNPFNPSTTVTFDLAQASDVTITVFDLLGREKLTLRPGTMAAGAHELRLDLGHLSSGVYLYRLRAGDDFVDSRRMVLVN